MDERHREFISGLDRVYKQLVETLHLAVANLADPEGGKGELEPVIQEYLTNVDRNDIGSLAGALRDLHSDLSDAIDAINEGRAYKSDKRNPLPDHIAVDFHHLMQRMFRSTIRPTKNQFEVEARYVATFSAFEVYCTQVFQHVYAMQPEVIAGEPTVPLSEIVRAVSVPQLIWWTAQRYASKAIEAPIADYLRSLLKLVGVDVPKRLSEWPEEYRAICEMSAIRNALVHAAGKIDDRTRSRFSELGTVLPNRERVQITPDELRKANEHLAEFCTDLYVRTVRTRISREFRPQANRIVLNEIGNMAWHLLEGGDVRMAQILSGAAIPHLADEWNEVAAANLCASLANGRNVESLLALPIWYTGNRQASFYLAVHEGRLADAKDIIEELKSDRIATDALIAVDARFLLYRQLRDSSH
jgi:hypothetical protein